MTERRKKYSVLYTHHKTQKSKKWQEGILWWNLANNKISLYDETEKQNLDSQFLKKGQTVEVNGDELETDRYLVQVEEQLACIEESSSSPAAPPSPSPSSTPTNSSSSSSSRLSAATTRRLKGTVGIKRTRSIASSSVGSQKEDDEAEQEGQTAPKQATNSNTLAPSFASFFTATTLLPPSVSLPVISLNSSSSSSSDPALTHATSAVDASATPSPSSSFATSLSTSSYTPPSSNGQQQQQNSNNERYEQEEEAPKNKNTATKRRRIGLSKARLKRNSTNNERDPSPPPTSSPLDSLDPAPSSLSLRRRSAPLVSRKKDEEAEEEEENESNASGQNVIASSALAKRIPGKPLHSSRSFSVRQSSLHNATFSSPISAWNNGHFCFPSKQICEEVFSGDKPPTHNVKIPDAFASLEEYKSVFMAALKEELNLQLLDLAHNFHSSCATCSTVSIGPNTRQEQVIVTSKYQCKHGPAKLLTVKKLGPNKGRKFYTCGAKARCNFFQWADDEEGEESENANINEQQQHQQRSLLPSLSGDKSAQKESAVERRFEMNQAAEEYLKTRGIRIYANCKLVKSGVQPQGSAGEGDYQQRGRRKKEVADSSVSGFEQRMMYFKKKALFLQLTWKEASSKYAKDDLWIISSSANFTPRNVDDTLFIARSAFHGPGQERFLEIEPLTELPKLGRSSSVHAIHGPEAGSILAMIDNLSLLTFERMPILPFLLKREPMQEESASSALCSSPLKEKKWKLDITFAEVTALADEVIQTYGLNEDQRGVLYSCLGWFETLPDQQEQRAPSPPVCLVHGVFGSGKSYLLVVLIIFLVRLLEKGHNEHVRILVAAATNTAVDRILQGLLEQGFNNFLRIGSLKKIAKPILELSPQADDKSAERELKQMLRLEELSGDTSGASVIQKVLDNVRSGRMKKLVQKVNKARVVGVTCAATVFPVLAGNTFPLVILDECSQMLEPISLLPLGKFGCEKLVAVGDPLQLPPVLESNFSREEEGLSKTLFIRLSNIGFEPLMLRTQYRCHPHISELANILFYSNKLRDGISPEARAPLAEGLPTLLFCNAIAGQEREDNFLKSYVNEHEVHVITELVKKLLDLGIAAPDIGIIALYKAQAIRVERALSSIRACDISPRYLQELLTGDKALQEELDGLGSTFDEEREADIFAKFQSKKWQQKQSNKLVAKDIQVSTVDAFQGSEKEVIIVTCTRTSRLGFIDSPKRLNVALTRARRHLFIVGHKTILMGNSTWKDIIERMQAVGVILDAQHFLRTKQLVPHCNASDAVITPVRHCQQQNTPNDEEQIDIELSYLEELERAHATKKQTELPRAKSEEEQMDIELSYLEEMEREQAAKQRED